MIRVAALIDTFTVSGPARQLTAVAAPLAAEDISLHVLAFHPAGQCETPFLEYLRENEVRHTPIPAHGRLHPKTLRSLNLACDALQPHVVQTHSYRPNAHILLSRALGRRREPWLAFFHGTTAEDRVARLYHAIDRRMLALADAVCVVADSQRTYLSNVTDVTVVPNAVLCPASDGRTAGPDSGRKVVLYVGRLSHEKGVDVLLDAWPGVLGTFPDASLVIVGDGPERPRLEQQGAALGVSGSVTFVGHQTSPWGFYERASLVVLPSRSEGVPNVMLEAIARDLRVVATRVGGIPDILGDPPAGTMVPAADMRSLCGAIIAKLGGEDSDRERSARARVRDEYSVTNRARQLAQRYRSLRSLP